MKRRKRSKTKRVRIQVGSGYAVLRDAIETAVKWGVHQTWKYKEEAKPDEQTIEQLAQDVNNAFWLALEEANIEVKP